MKGFIIGTLATALTFAIVSYVLPAIDYGGDPVGLLIVSLIAGVVNGLLKPILKLVSLPLNMMTLGLFGLVINAGAPAAHRLAVRPRSGSRSRSATSRRTSRSTTADDRADRRRRDQPRGLGRRHGGPGLSEPDRLPEIEGALRTAARRFGTPGLRHGPRHAGCGRRRRPRGVPRSVGPAVLGQGQRRAGGHRRGRASAGSAPTSCRAASGRSRRVPACPNDRISLEGIGKTPADLRAAVRAASDGTPLRWVALESVDEAVALAGLVRRAGGGLRLDVLYRLNPDVAPGDARRAGGRAPGRPSSG